MTPLHISCMYGHTECVKLLLDKGAYKEAICKDKQTPLYIACNNGHTECVKLLLENNANKT